MKRVLTMSALALSCLLFSCTKEKSLSELDNTNAGGQNDYQPTSAGSEWNYNSTSIGNYKMTSLGTDTLVNGAKFYKFDNSLSGRQYVGKANGVYSAYAASPMGNNKITMIMLKDAPIGTTWTNTFNNQGTVSNYVYKVVSRDVDKTVNGKVFKNVIGLEYEAFAIDPTDPNNKIKFATGTSFTAKGVGAISGSFKMDFFGVTMEDSTYVVSYIIK